MSNLLHNLLNLMERANKGKRVNPWAVCHSSTGPEKSDKFERCVKDVKKKQGVKEGIKESDIPLLVELSSKVLKSYIKKATQDVRAPSGERNPKYRKDRSRSRRGKMIGKAQGKLDAMAESIVERIEANRAKVKALKKKSPDKFKKPKGQISTAGMTTKNDPGLQTAVKSIHQGRAERAATQAKKRPLKDI